MSAGNGIGSAAFERNLIEMICSQKGRRVAAGARADGLHPRALSLRAGPLTVGAMAAACAGRYLFLVEICNPTKETGPCCRLEEWPSL